MKYSVFIRRSAQKFLARMPGEARTRAVKAIRALGDRPRPAGAKKLSGRDAWRIRVGTYRIIYEIRDDRLVVAVVTIGHRKDVYR